MARLSSIAVLSISLAAQAPAVADTRYFVRPTTFSADVENDEDRRRAAESIAVRMTNVCPGQLVTQEAESAASVQLHVTDVKKVGVGSRILIGPFRGNSHVALDMSLFDGQGKLVSKKHLTESGNWFKGSVSMGGSDAHMLTVLAQDVCNALQGTAIDKPVSAESDAAAPAVSVLAPAPSDSGAQRADPAERLRALEKLKTSGLISQEEYDRKRAEILREL